MLALSTAYNIHECKSWTELLKETRSLGFDSIELNVNVPEEWFNDIDESVKKQEISVCSVHNYCPQLTDLMEGMNVFFAYSLSSVNEEERKKAVKYTLKSIETAKRFNAGAVVVHAGEVPMSPSGRDLFVYAAKFGRNGKLFDDYLKSVKDQRAKTDSSFKDKLSKSLEAVLNYAGKNNIFIGLETRMYYHEIPVISEIGHFLSKFEGSNLGYWHDTGHAELNIRLGLVEKHEDFLEPFKEKLIGVHLHDMKKLKDHYAPGEGDFNFNVIKKYLKNDTIKVMEVHKKSDKKSVKKGIQYLKSAGIA
jgi:sugar phosphate isomerase/epimerase